MTHEEFLVSVSKKVLKVWEDGRQYTLEGRSELNRIHMVALSNAKHGKWYAENEFWTAKCVESEEDDDELDDLVKLAQDEIIILRQCGYGAVGAKLEDALAETLFESESKEEKKGEIARRIVRNYWGNEAAIIVETCLKVNRFRGTAIDFLKLCEQANINGSRILLTGLKKAFPEVYGTIPNYTGRPAYRAIVAALFLCGVEDAYQL